MIPRRRTQQAVASGWITFALVACSVYDESLLARARNGSSRAGGAAGISGSESESGGNAGRAGDEAPKGGVPPISAGGAMSDRGGMGGASGTTHSQGGTSVGRDGGAGGADSEGGEGDSGSAGAPSLGGTGTGGGATGGTAGSGGAAGGSGGTIGKGGAGGVATGGAAKGGSSGMNQGGASGGAAGGAGTGGSSVLFFDDFESGNASRWSSNSASDFGIATDGSRVFRQNAVSPELRVARAGSASWTDQVVEARLKVVAFGDGVSSSYFVSLCARYVDESNHYYVAFRSDGRMAIRRKVAGSNSTIGSAFNPPQPISTGTWYSVRLEVVGTTLRAYLNGTLLSTQSDSSIAAGMIAVGSNNASAVFDDVRVTPP